MLLGGWRHLGRTVLVCTSFVYRQKVALRAPRIPLPTSFATKVPDATSITMDPKAPAGVLPCTRDRFRGVTVDTDITAIDVQQFPETLKKSLDWWKQLDCRAIWFRINLASTALVPLLAQHGFDFHHARDGFVMMVHWIGTNEPANIPPFAHHMVGVGGLVINARDQILAVSERQSVFPGSWKLPGGYVEPAENLVEAAVREVLEETGIRTRFESLISVRHSHHANFDCSDLYVVMALRTLDDGPAVGGSADAAAPAASGEAPDEIRTCPREIADARWMEFDEYLNHPKVHDLNRNVLREYLRNREAGVCIGRTEGVHPMIRRKYNVYSVDLANAKL